MELVHFSQLPEVVNLEVGPVYSGGAQGNAGDDPISILTGSGNQGGFRMKLTRDGSRPAYVVLYSDFAQPEWPDEIRDEGRFAYYGDNRKPGHELHDTPHRGNALLREAFTRVYSGRPRSDIP